MPEPNHYSMKLEPGEFQLNPTDSVGAFIIHRRLPDDHPAYALIGRVTAEWAELEHILDLITWDLSGVGAAVASCITGQFTNFGQRVDAILALATHKGMPVRLLKRFERLKNNMHEIAKTRNRYVHDAWYVEDGTGDLAQFQSVRPKRGRYGMATISSNDIEDVISMIRDRQQTAKELWAAISEQLRA